MIPTFLRREGHDPQRPVPSPEVPEPTEPVDGDRHSEPGPGPEPMWTPEHEPSTPVTGKEA
jgi:hypothetical protein